MPETLRRLLLGAAITLAAIAGAGNLGHVYDWARTNGQGTVLAPLIAASPDVLLVLSVIRVRYHRRSPVAWAGLAASVGFVVWASVSTARGTFAAQLISVWLVLVAVLAAAMLEAKPQAAAPVQVHVQAPVREAPQPRAPRPPCEAPAPLAASPQIEAARDVASLAATLAAKPREEWPSVAEMRARGWGGQTRCEGIRREARALQASQHPHLVAVP